MATAATGVIVWATLSPSSGASAPKPASAPAGASASAPDTKAQDAKSAGALLRSALDRQMHQDLSGAAEEYRRVLQLDARNKNAWYGLGVIAQQNGRAAEARKNFEKALEIDPHFMSALYSEAFMLRSTEPDQAIELLQRASAANPKVAAVHLQLGQLLAEADREDEAEDAFRRAVGADPKVLSQVPEKFRDAVSG
ncbi:tetratricopeptide repeat protein [Streptomyces sp. 5-8]|uniref:Tetratricopeptide repeat protein n=1 Tax=Streptomyces musisoli TaxID=2802280 RepID=A0ABS1P0M0_9ACTN|nr:tetratricopeptide repeat protein [Streptomyces musisoli]MBL1105868.1 tetratricopeptide repeat protein [Streptomyces musisoli]